MRRAVRVAVPIGVVAAMAGCGPVNAGSAFEEQFEPFLAGRDAVVEQSISSQNTLPWSGTAEVGLTLEEGLSDDEIVEEVLAIVSHGVDDPVRYSLTVRFASPAGDGSEGVAAAGFEVAEPLDPDDVREATSERIASARALVALGSGPTRMGTMRSPFPMTSEADALEVARKLCARPELVAGFDDVVGIVTGPVDLESGTLVDGGRETARVEHDFGADCGDVEAAAGVLEQARSRTTVLGYDLRTWTHADSDLTPSLDVKVDSQEALAGLVADAEADGVRLKITVPAAAGSPSATPSTSTPTPTPSAP